MVKGDFLFNNNHQYSNQDAYVLGNLFSYNYIDTIDKYGFKRASFISKKRAPQNTNATGFEYDLKSFERYRESLLSFFGNSPKYKDIDIKILWDDDIDHEGVFKKTRGVRCLYFNIEFESIKDFKEILNTVRWAINSLELFIWFLRGIVDTRGSIDKSTKKIAVDMDTYNSFEQAKEIEILSSKFFEEINKFTNYNPRSSQPSNTSKKKNPQLRPNLKHFLSKVGTINPQLIQYYEYLFDENNGLVLTTEDGEYYVVDEKIPELRTEQKNRLTQLKQDDKSRLLEEHNWKSVKPNAERRTLTNRKKVEIWESTFNCSTLDDNEIDFVLAEWHHAIPNNLKKLKDYVDIHNFIDSDKNYVPLSPDAHSLIHKSDDKLSGDLKEMKQEILYKIWQHISIYVSINLEELKTIYR